MLNFIASAVWTRLFGHTAELLKGSEGLSVAVADLLRVVWLLI